MKNHLLRISCLLLFISAANVQGMDLNQSSSASSQSSEAARVSLKEKLNRSIIKINDLKRDISRTEISVNDIDEIAVPLLKSNPGRTALYAELDLYSSLDKNTAATLNARCLALFNICALTSQFVKAGVDPKTEEACFRLFYGASAKYNHLTLLNEVYKELQKPDSLFQTSTIDELMILSMEEKLGEVTDFAYIDKLLKDILSEKPSHKDISVKDTESYSSLSEDTSLSGEIYRQLSSMIEAYTALNKTNEDLLKSRYISLFKIHAAVSLLPEAQNALKNEIMKITAAKYNYLVHLHNNVPFFSGKYSVGKRLGSRLD